MPAINLEKANQFACRLVLTLLLLLGLYFPTSFAGGISNMLFVCGEGLVVTLFFLLLLLTKLGSYIAVSLSVFLFTILIISTFFSPLSNISLGVLPNFLAITLLFFLNLRPVKWAKWLSCVFLFVNILNMLLIAGIILDIQIVDQFLTFWYASFYPELLPNMLGQNKPVLTFATHSIAGFMLLLFFYLNLKTYSFTRNSVWLIFSLGYLFACWRLVSVMGYLSSFFAIACLAHTLIPRKKIDLVKLIYFILPTLFLGLTIFFVIYSNQTADIVVAAIELIEKKMLSHENGLLGRYASGGVLGVNIQYIIDHPFQPTGLSTNNSLYFVDSGPVEYVLRGSFLMLFSMYAGYLAFLKFNLRSSRSTLFLFVILLLAELGFSYLKYFRFQAVLPFAIVYLNHLQQVKYGWTR